MVMRPSAVMMQVAANARLEAGPCDAPARPIKASKPYPAPDAVVNSITE